MAAMIRVDAPTISVIVGEGGSGGALAFAVADRLLMQERAIYSVIAPEGAAAILYRDASRAPELADQLKITAQEVRKLGISDGTITEPKGGAKADPAAAARRVKICHPRSPRRAEPDGPGQAPVNPVSPLPLNRHKVSDRVETRAIIGPGRADRHTTATPAPQNRTRTGRDRSYRDM